MMDDATKQALMNHLKTDVTYPMKGSDLKATCNNWSDVPQAEAHRVKVDDEKMYNSAEEVMAELEMGGAAAGTAPAM